MTGERITSETNDPVRRLKPRMIDSDWLVMRGMAREIRAAAARVGAPGLTVVDYGCGNMPYRPLFQATGARYLGADFDGAPDIAIDASGRMDLGDASADVVVSFQVLEHVRDLGAYFSEARRVLKPGGRLVLSTHGTWLYHPHPEDHRRWTREGLIAEMGQHGFAVEDCAAVAGPLAWTTVLRLTGYCYVLKRVPLIGLPLAFVLSTIMNARAWLEDALTPASITRDNACVYVTLSRPAEFLVMLKDARFRYLLVGGFCAGVHNAIMIGGGLLGAHYVASSVVSFCLVLVLGFVLHARFTFAVHADWRSFAKYAAGMLINLPLWIGLMYVLAGLCRLPMIVASPLGTIMFVGWNFLVSRWAIAHRRPPLTPRAINASAPDAKQGRLSES